MDEPNDADPGMQRGGLGGAVLDDVAIDDLLQRMVQLARVVVGDACAVSITVRAGGRFQTSNSTDVDALAIDKCQYEDDRGPCLEALRTGRQVEAAVGSEDGSWPRFTDKAQGLGVTGVLSTPLLRGGESIGALNIYATDGGRFSEDELTTARVIADHAAILVGSATALIGASELNEQLRQAVASREIIGEAKGILMENQSCTRDEAFDILRRASQRENRKLRELAEELVLRVETRARDRKTTK